MSDEENNVSPIQKAHSSYLSTSPFICEQEWQIQKRENNSVSKYTLSFKFIYALEHVSKRRSEEVWMKNKVLTPWEILFIGIKKEILSTILKARGLGEVDIYAYPRECCNHKF